MVAVAIAGFFLIVAFAVGLVLLDSGLKFMNAAKALSVEMPLQQQSSIEQRVRVASATPVQRRAVARSIKRADRSAAQHVAA